MRREVTFTRAFSWMVALVGGAAALSWAFLLFLADREQRAVTVAAGGLALAVWAAIHLTERQHRRS